MLKKINRDISIIERGSNIKKLVEVDKKYKTNFDKVMKSVIPQAVEEAYFSLFVNVLLAYNIVRDGEKEMTIGLEILDKEAQLKEQIINLVNEENMTLKSWNEIMELAKDGKRNCTYKQQILSFQMVDPYFVKDVVDPNVTLTDTINTIKNIFNDIKELDIDGQRRINRLQAMIYNFVPIDKNRVLSKAQRHLLKNLFFNYTKLLINSFKALDNFGHQLVKKYNKNEITKYTFKSQLWQAALKGLGTYTKTFENDIMLIVKNQIDSTPKIEEDITNFSQLNLYIANELLAFSQKY